MSTRSFILVLFVFAFCLRFGVSLVLPEKETLLSDSREYRDIALNIVGGDGFLLHEDAKAKRPPGYPLFLALPEWFFPGQLEALFAAQAFLGALVCVFVFGVGFVTLGKFIAVMASFLCAAYPLLIYSGVSLLVEPLYSCLFLLEIFFLVRAQTSWKSGWGAGFFGGAACLVQAGHLFFFVPVLLYRRGRYLIPYLTVFFLLIGVWSVRNRVVLGEWVPLTTQSGYTLFESIGPSATGGTVGPNMGLPDREEKGEVEYDRLLRDQALDSITPNRFLVLALQKQKYFWSILPHAEGMKNAKAYIATLCFLPVLVGFLIALVKWKRIPEAAGWLLLPIVYTAVLHLVFLGSIRYRLAVEPFLILLACWGMWQFILGGALSGRGAAWRNLSRSSE